MLKLKIDVRGIDVIKRELAKLPEELRDKAFTMGINRAAEKANTEAKRAISQEYAISSKQVGAQIVLRKANKNTLTATIFPMSKSRDIFGQRRSLNVVHFMEKSITLAAAKRRAKAGKLYAIGHGGRKYPILHFKFKRVGGQKIIEGAFIGNKGRTVFVREPGTTMDSRSIYSGSKHAEKIRPVQVIDVPQMFSSRKSIDRIKKKIDQELPREMARAVQLVLDRSRWGNQYLARRSL